MNEPKSIISFDEVFKLDVRTCKVIAAEPVTSNGKYIKLTLDTGEKEIPCVTNLGSHYIPEDFIGAVMPFVMNLAPVTIAKHQSEAMIMAAKNPDGTYALLETEDKTVGAVVL